MESVDILMVTWNRPDYVAKSLPPLLAQARARSARLWIWQNGRGEAAARVVEELVANHPGVVLHVEPENVGLRKPMNWFVEVADGDYLGKVDDDCVCPGDWLDRFVGVMAEDPRLAGLSCWPFLVEDISLADLQRKLTPLVQNLGAIMRTAWLGGSGVLFRGDDLRAAFPLVGKESLQSAMVRISRQGKLFGYPFPFLLMDHFDDPRSPNCGLMQPNGELRLGYTAQRRGLGTLESAIAANRAAARAIQRLPADPRVLNGYRARMARLVTRLIGRDVIKPLR